MSAIDGASDRWSRASAAGELVWSRVDRHEPTRSGWFYVELFHLAAARARTRTRALFIGCGAGVALRQFAEVYPGMAIDVVESDPRVVELAQRWFALGSIPNVSVHFADGAAFMREATDTSWDVVIVDAYDATELGAGLAGRPFFADVRRVLRPGGCLGFNVIGTLAGAGAVQEIERAARSALGDVRPRPSVGPGRELRRGCAPERGRRRAPL